MVTGEWGTAANGHRSHIEDIPTAKAGEHEQENEQCSEQPKVQSSVKSTHKCTQHMQRRSWQLSPSCTLTWDALPEKESGLHKGGTCDTPGSQVLITCDGLNVTFPLMGGILQNT